MTGRRYDRAELNRLIPPLPKPKRSSTNGCIPSAAISDDNAELIARLGQRSPKFGRLYAGDTSDFEHDHLVNTNEVDWALSQELLRATGGDQARTYLLMRQSGLERPKWDDRRGDQDYLAYTIGRAAASPSEAPAYHGESAPIGPCSTCAIYRRQIDLINQLVRSDLPKMYKLVLLYLVAVVGFTQARGQATFTLSGKKLGQAIGASAQSARGVLHGIARNDRGTLTNPHGVIDLDATRAPELGPFASVFEVTTLTEGGYVGFLEAVLANAADLNPPPKPRQSKREPVPPAAFVEAVPDCRAHRDELTVTEEPPREVVCAECGEPFLAMTRTVYYAQNDKNYHQRYPQVATGGGVGSQSDKNYRSEPPPPLPADWSERLAALYERAGVRS